MRTQTTYDPKAPRSKTYVRRFIDEYLNICIIRSAWIGHFNIEYMYLFIT